MAKRHQFDPTDWASVFGRLEEIVLARSGEDAFDEIYKLVLVKLYEDRLPQDSGRAHDVGDRDRIDGRLAEMSSKWPDLFLEQTATTRLDSDLLAQCEELLDQVDLSHTSWEVFDAIFEHLNSRTSKSTKGQFFTPRIVIEASVKILDPRPEELIADTACGSGGFLVHAYRHASTGLSPKQALRFAEHNIWGFDFDQRAVQSARALLLFASGVVPPVFRVDSLATGTDQMSLLGDDAAEESIESIVKQSIKRFRGFDVILTNPPFAGDVLDKNLLAQYEVAFDSTRMERDALFLERNVKLLRPGGRIAIVLPHNKLAGRQTARLREWLVQNLQVVGVLGLGRETFMPHTSQKACVLFGIRRASGVGADQDEAILFEISEKSGKTSKGEWIFRDEVGEDLPLWERVDHDLSHAVDHFLAHLDSQAIEFQGGGR